MVHYSEEWESEDAFRRHVRSGDLWRVLVAMDLSEEEPRVGIGDLSASEGMEVLRKLRDRLSCGNETAAGGAEVNPKRL